MAKDEEFVTIKGGSPIPTMRIVLEYEKKGAPIPSMQPATPSQSPSQQVTQPGTSNQGGDSTAGSGDKK